jgi:hypothetical protein
MYNILILRLDLEEIEIVRLSQRALFNEAKNGSILILLLVLFRGREKLTLQH